MVHLIKEYITSYKKTGAICPSSPRLAEYMTNEENLLSSRCVIELGPGSGVITKKILTKISKKCTFFALEINPVFAEKVEKDLGATVYLDSAQNIQKYLQKHNLQHCDMIISSLPWSFFNQQTQKHIFESLYNSLTPEGKIVTFVYLTIFLFPSGRRFMMMLNQHFPNIQKKVVWKNIPPAIVYECRK